MKKVIFALATAAALLLSCAHGAKADSFNYTDSATATGTIGATAFTDTLVTVTFTGDTADISTFAGSYVNYVGTESVTISGIGTFAIPGFIHLFDNPAVSSAGISGPGGDVLDTTAAPFATYNLASAIGPVSGAPTINAGFSFATTGGAFVLDSVAGDSTFTAAPVAATPESGTVLLLMTGLVGLGLYRRGLTEFSPNREEK